MKNLLLFLCCLHWMAIDAQNTSPIKWWNPTQHPVKVIEGQGWNTNLQNPYQRLPQKMKDSVRKPVWSLSQHSAGLMIRFRSNAAEIQIRYGTGNDTNYGMNHMPATGVSGVDLYAIDSDGKERWCTGRRSFADTISYRYLGLKPNDNYHKLGREYRLYLPLYNNVEWLEIGVKNEDYFKPLPIRKEKPILVYGTSIAQGACASRPGMAWTAILGRKLDRPLINLGFSGNGRLETPLLNLLAEIDAKIYILDCLPNLTSDTWSDKELKDKVLDAVRLLKEKRPSIPILLVEHAGYTDAMIRPKRGQAYERVNRLQKEAYYQLKKEGIKDLFYLTKEEIGLQLDDMVDGTHPTDLGMAHYAASYEKCLRAILNEPTGNTSTTQPIIQYREPGNYDWEERHREILQINATDPPKMVIIANSIIHFWGGQPKAKLARETASWQEYFTPMGLNNYAYGWDRVENVLWRVFHGELDGFEAEKIFVMIGTNNLHLNNNDEIISGLDLLMQAIKVRQPKAKIVLMGILPRRDNEDRVATLNLEIARLAGTHRINYADLGEVFLNENGKIQETLFSDGLHPNAAGYMALRGGLKELLEE